MNKEQQASDTPPAGQWSYNHDDSAALDVRATDADQQPVPDKTSDEGKTVAWTASEFIAHPKGIGWYVLLVLVAVCMVAGVYLLTHDMLSMFAVGALAIMFGVVASRQPRMLEYRLDSSGLTAGERSYPYGNYKSFAIMDEGIYSSIVLLPYKRFSPPFSMYATPDDQKRVVEALSKHLPLELGGADPIDRLMHHIHF